MNILSSNLTELNKAALIDYPCLIQFLTTVDMSIALLAQAISWLLDLRALFLDGGLSTLKLLQTPSLHASFLIQNILKSVGCLLGTFVWFASPEKA